MTQTTDGSSKIDFPLISETSPIFVAGHNGLVGSAIVRRLQKSGYKNLITRSRSELDLLEQASVRQFMQEFRPEFIFLAAAKVGGILANNSQPADFIYQNLVIETNIIHSAYQAGVKRLMFLGSSCIYPRECPQPMKEEHLLTGPLEPTNEPYALAKIAGIKLCESYNCQYGTCYISVMPTNLYGPNDNFDLNSSHVLPALLRKMHEAKQQGSDTVNVWGSGNPRREFLHVDDMASACVFLMENNVRDGIFNIGVGNDTTIRELAEMIKEVVGVHGALVFDASKPDGTPRKLLDVSRMDALGWKHSIGLRDGVSSVYQWYLDKLSK